MTDPIAAMLDQLAAHAEQIRQLDAREAASSAEASRQITELATLAKALSDHVTALAAQVSQDSAGSAGGGAGRHHPAPARRWLELSGDDRDHAISAVRAWVEQVYQPGYGQLAAALGPCWHQHALCLHILDILAELWTVLYQAGQRSPALLSAQAEFQARILPALADQMSAETSRCRHARERLTAPATARRTP